MVVRERCQRHECLGTVLGAGVSAGLHYILARWSLHLCTRKAIYDIKVGLEPSVSETSSPTHRYEATGQGRATSSRSEADQGCLFIGPGRESIMPAQGVMAMSGMAYLHPVGDGLRPWSMGFKVTYPVRTAWGEAGRGLSDEPCRLGLYVQYLGGTLASESVSFCMHNYTQKIQDAVQQSYRLLLDLFADFYSCPSQSRSIGIM